MGFEKDFKIIASATAKDFVDAFFAQEPIVTATGTTAAAFFPPGRAGLRGRPPAQAPQAVAHNGSLRALQPEDLRAVIVGVVVSVEHRQRPEQLRFTSCCMV